MAQLFIHHRPLNDEEIRDQRVKRFLALPSEVRIKQGLALISMTAKIRMSKKPNEHPGPRIRIKKN